MSVGSHSDKRSALTFRHLFAPPISRYIVGSLIITLSNSNRFPRAWTLDTAFYDCFAAVSPQKFILFVILVLVFIRVCLFKMEPYLVAAIVVIVTTIVVVVLWIKGKSDSGIESKASAISPTKQPSPVPTLPIKRAPSPVSDEVNALDDTPREKAVVWEEIEGVQVVEVDYNDHSDEHEDHESPDQHLNTEDRGQTEEQHEDTYDEEEGEVFDENRDSQAGFEEDHYDEGDYQDESPRVSESNVSPLSPDAPAAEEKRSPPKRTVSRTLSKESSGSLSPMGNPAGKTLYKFGSHYKKGGDSWVVNQNTEATAAAASPVGVSPVRMPQLKKIIPVHNESQPLSRKQSNKISQCKSRPASFMTLCALLAWMMLLLFPLSVLHNLHNHLFCFYLHFHDRACEY